MKKFKIQILAPLTALILLVVTVMTFVGYNAFQKESLSLNKRLLTERNVSISDKLGEKFSAYKRELGALTVDAGDIFSRHLSDEANAQLRALEKAQSSITDGIYLFTKDGSIYNSSGKLLSFNVKQLNREYYRAIFIHGDDFYISSPFESAVTQKQVLGMAHRVSDSAAILSNVYLDSVLEGYSSRDDMFVYTAEGTLLVSPYPEQVGKNVYQERPGYRNFNADHRELSYVAVVDGVDVPATALWGDLPMVQWQFVTVFRDEVIEQGAQAQLLKSVVIGVLSLILSLCVVQVLVDRLILKPVGGAPKEIEAIVKALSQGNLVQQFNKDGSESGIHASVIDLSEKLKALIHNSHKLAGDVANSCVELTEAMDKSGSNAKEELSQVEQVSTAINELSATSQEMSANAAVAQEATLKAQESSESGKHTLENNIVLVDSINRAIGESELTVRELTEYAQEIGSVTDVIEGISEQTNLLALNAAIEAARAGEHGRGFAVVADEVRNLASKTQQSTVSIKELIDKLQTQSQAATENMSRNVSLIAESVQATEEVKSSFEEITNSVKSIADINSLLATSSQEQFCVTEDISKNTALAFDLVNQNVAYAYQVSTSVRALAELSEKQKRELEFFTV
ncbi:methyl-accepting chemotaxis protein [Ferrimonas sp. YFM]|uniref:methyl-accepting chemotaxis protein n=1 Tax=Ferrimonas sp. YFM TaxID=3028878 RepID=UPI00257382C7|nr:methyl-accepting chemotaxis protein [Ferrimonas sp. YFM]BDY05128.1 methyl-accepting chemotaxis protein [Ferrimonas sp. YFM]